MRVYLYSIILLYTKSRRLPAEFDVQELGCAAATEGGGGGGGGEQEDSAAKGRTRADCILVFFGPGAWGVCVRVCDVCVVCTYVCTCVCVCLCVCVYVGMFMCA